MQVIEYRRALHRIPELDRDLPETLAYLRSVLEPLGCALFSPIPGALCAFFDFGKADAIAFRSDADALPIQEQTGLPCVFIEADLAHLADAFRTLGIILGKEERGEELAKLVEETMTMAAENSAKITEDQQLSVLYSSGSDPLGTNAEGSSQAQALGIVGAKNAVVLEDVSNKGGGNMINMEQLYNFDPDVVLVTDAAALEIIKTEAAWQELRAVKDGRVYTVPCDPYCWLSAPPSMIMILGVWWLGNLLYPEVYDYDMTAKTQEIYKVFWNYDLTAEEAAAMLG